MLRAKQLAMNDVPLYPKLIDDQRVLNSNLPHSCKAVSTIRAQPQFWIQRW